MTQTKNYTKGPWDDNDAGLIYGQVSGDTDEAPFVCDCCENGGSGIYTEQERANARLIAAAPELLESLSLLIDQIESLHDQSSCINEDLEQGEAYRLARAAIVKARG